MRFLILNGSPKKRSSTSKFLGRIVGLLLTGSNIQYASLRMKSEYPKIMQYQTTALSRAVITNPI